MLTLLQGPPLPPPPAEQRQNSDIACLLAHRFARVLTLRHRHRHLTRPTSCSRRRRLQASRNCASKRRQDARARRSEPDQLDDANLDASIRSLQAHIASLECSTLLRDSATLLWRVNNSAVALDLTREYFLQFARGYDSTDGERSATTKCFVTRVFRPDVVCRDFQGLETLLDQWDMYTSFHQELTFELSSIRLVDDTNQSHAVTVHATAMMELTFIQDTLKFLYPSLLTQSQEREIAYALVGKRGQLPVELVLNFDHEGHVFAFESRVNLVAALLEMLHSPSAAVRAHQSSLMTTDGHWQAVQDAHEAAKRKRLLPRQVL